MTPTVKMIIGILLLVVGAWVTWSGIQQGETVTIVLGVASLVGGVAFLIPRPRGGTVATRD